MRVFRNHRSEVDTPNLSLNAMARAFVVNLSLVCCLLPRFLWSRIGRAESSDGLNWRRTAGQMALSSVLDKNTEQWWCFDTAHVGLGDVNLGASSKVVTESSVYFMYYFGGDYEETDVQAEFGLSNVRTIWGAGVTAGVRVVG